MVSLACATAALILVLGCVSAAWVWREIKTLECLDDIDYWIDGDDCDHLITKI